MTALEQLNAYLRRLELRLRLFAASRGAAVVAGIALLLTVLLVWISNRYEFANHVVLPLRILLFAVLAAAVCLAFAVPLSKLSRRRITQLAERQAPGFEQRLLTVTERPDPTNPFTELVAEDALRLAKENEPERLSPLRRLVAFAGSGAVAAAVLIWLIAAGPGYWGYGASLLWTGHDSSAKRPLYDITVKPGNATIRRKSDQRINAQLLGFSAHSVRLFAKYGSALKWDEAPMQPKSDGSGYQFLFAGLSEPVEYYVRADSALSKHFTINVKDLPVVKRVKVSLHFPPGLGLRDEVQDPGGDLRAVEGTQADISILTDRHLDRGQIVLEDGSKLPLGHSDGEWLTARLNVQKDGSYHIAAIDGSDAVRISDDFFIEAKKDEPPTVKISRPGHDAHVSPIEELPVTVEAADDFGLKDVQLHYSVNGGDEKTVTLLKKKDVKEATGTSTLALEDFNVVPGDLVSFYATARDAGKTARSEILFATAEPFDFKFSQSQQMGGGGGGGGAMDNNNNISERQKQIIAATFNQLGGSRSGPVIGGAVAAGASVAENARFLSDAEGKLSEQAKTLAERMSSRELSQAGAEFQNFSKLMTQASGQMTAAGAQLKPGKWHDALPPEQKALQSLLRAEALFRDIQVAFGQQSGGGGGSMGAQRDLARMFDLELDTSKNQYETGQSDNSGGSKDQQKAIDDAFQKLEALARRQQELAAQNQTQQAFEQRWQEEQLRREAEELRQQMQQMAQNHNQQGQQQNSQSQSGQPSSSSSSSSSQSSQSGSSGSQNSRANNRMQNARNAQSPEQQQQEAQNAEAMRRAATALQRAEEEMRKAVSDRDSTAQQRASADLQEAEQTLRNMLHDQAGSSVSGLSNRAQDIANQQRELAERMKQMYGTGSPASKGRNGYEQQANTSGSGEDMPEMNDPNSSRYGWGFRRRNWQPMQLGRSATDQEKAMAAEKEKLAAQLQQLEQQMQKEAESMAGTQPGVSTKMRKALSDAEQKELALRMQKDAEWLKQGYGDRNVGMEDNVTAGLDELSRQLRDLQQAIKSGDTSGNPGQNQRTEEALSQLRGLREQLQQQSEQLQRGDSGQDGGDRQARQSGSQQGSSGTSPRGGPGDQQEGRGVQDAIGQLNWLRTQVDPRDRTLGGYIDGALWNLHHLTGAQAGLLDSRINHDAVASLQRLEMEMNRRLVTAQAQGARTGAPEPAPEKYREAVSEYFKKLSQP
ncbi:MAG TPA: hypothetical protein VH302_00075 [Bryobacteraceae bacterium]|nr:hypothetical protein [Bryobacteraceae bacterium]